jgi:zinc/manganese transport system substrate-binding protein
MKFWSLSILLLLAAVRPASAQDKLEVASLSMVLTDIARNVGGDVVNVVGLVQPGVDPHDFEPSVRDLKTISQARIVLASGLGFEPYLPKLQKSVPAAVTFLVVGDSIRPILLEAGDDPHHHDHAAPGHQQPAGKIPDPHWWHSIPNVEIATRVIRDAFIAADPTHKSTYQKNAAAYLRQLAALEKWAKLEIARIPRDKRILVTSHDALGYFAHDYHFEIHPVEGVSTREQPSSRRVRELIDEIKAEGVKSIFAENIENPKVLGEITRETGATLGGTLYADGLGDKQASTYDAMMRHNITTIVSALQ